MSNGYASHSLLNNRSFTTAILHRFAWLIIAGLFIATAGSGLASTVPGFFDNFDYTDGTTLDGSNEWGVVTSEGSVIATNFTAQMIDATLTNAFSDATTSVTITFEAQPQFSDGVPTIPDDVTYAFYVKTNGLITAYNGTTASNLSHTALSTNSFTDIEIALDYFNKKWSLRVGGTEVATTFDFYSISNSAFKELIFIETSTDASYIDSVNISTTNSLAHSGDVNADWKVDSGEITSALSYFRTAAGYHVNTSSSDGYAPGAGLQVGLPHSADVNADWKIDSGEITSMLSYFRTAAGYHINTSSADGFAPGAP